MGDGFKAKIRVFDESGRIADVEPTDFRQPDIAQIATVTNQIVVQLQNTLQSDVKENTSSALSLSEIELTFGIDFEVEAGADLKIPIIGPAIHGTARGGATFEVHITLSRGGSQ